jgi:hypothetical protein
MKYFSVFIFLLLTGFYLLAPMIAFAQCPPGYENLCKVGPDTNPDLFANIVQFLIVIAIVVSAIFMIWGGIKWVTSGGDKGKVEQARGAITGAIIGLLISLLAFAIVSIVVYLFTGSASLNFKIPTLIQ